jgi:hypothetical protein
MTGLVWVNRLTLQPAQWGVMLASMAILLRYGITWKSLGCVHVGLVASFWNTPLSTDTRLLFQSARYLQRFTWSQFLSEFAYRDYVKLQPPLYTFWLSRIPAMGFHQIAQAAILVLAGLLMVELYGVQAKYLLATPLYLLMSTQPGNDVTLFVALLCVMRLTQVQRTPEAAALYGLSFCLKPLMLVTVPFLLPRLRGWFLLTVGLIAIYYTWSIRFHFGVIQWNFLAQQLLFKKLYALLHGAGSI